MEHIPASEIPLGRLPVIASAARGLHGHAGKLSVERFCLPELWCIHLYPYQATLRADDHELAIRPGTVTVIPAGCQLEYKFQDVVTHYYAHFSLPDTEGETPVRVPMLTDLGPGLQAFEQAFRLVVLHARLRPTRAAVRLWDLLWQLVEKGETAPRRHPCLESAMSLIELRLGQPLSAAALAREVGLSHNQLTRLFRAETGESIVGYIRERRAARAVHLLRNSSLPLKSIGRQINCLDARSFNALMKKETGKPPGAWREG